jgi:hypothetical protein
LQGTETLLTDRKKVAFRRSIPLELRTRTEPVRAGMYEGYANAVKRKIEQAGLVIDIKCLSNRKERLWRKTHVLKPRLVEFYRCLFPGA